MPVGRFREDPRELGDEERAVYARQHAEGLLTVGSLLGVGIPYGLSVVAPGLVSPVLGRLAALVGVLVGGIGGYLLGYAYRERKLRAVREDVAGGGGTETDSSPVAPDGEGPQADRNAEADR